jgi:hypothetical protein
MGAELGDDNGLSFTHSYSVVSDGDLDISVLRKLSTILTQFELVEVSTVVLLCLVGFVDL